MKLPDKYKGATPGPWESRKVFVPKKGWSHRVTENFGGKKNGVNIICQMVFDSCESDEQRDANARLIADGPTLAVLVQRLCEWNAKYPSSRIYGEADIRKIAAEMDELYKDARQLLEF